LDSLYLESNKARQRGVDLMAKEERVKKEKAERKKKPEIPKWQQALQRMEKKEGIFVSRDFEDRVIVLTNEGHRFRIFKKNGKVESY